MEPEFIDDEDQKGDGKEEEDVEEETEEGFMKGYSDEEEVEECAECGTAIKKKKVTREIEGEEYPFCSEICAKEFEESLATTEE